MQNKWKATHKRERINDPEMVEYIEKKLKSGWSPEIISNKMEEDIGKSVSHEAIYQFIYKARNDFLDCRDVTLVYPSLPTIEETLRKFVSLINTRFYASQ